MKKKDINSLLEPETAVEHYLDNLLQEIPEETETQKPLKVKDNIFLLPDFEIQSEHEVTHTFDADKLADDENIAAEALAEQEVVESASTEAEVEASKPRYLDFDYPVQCLMFKVAGTQLSIPLIEMGSVLSWVDNMTQLPSADSWSMGVLQHRERNIKVVNTANLLNIRAVDQEVEPKHILVFGDNDWALSCDELGQVVKLESDQVQWNREQITGFSMGTIKDSLAQLLDPLKIIQHLERIGSADACRN